MVIEAVQSIGERRSHLGALLSRPRSISCIWNYVLANNN